MGKVRKKNRPTPEKPQNVEGLEPMDVSDVFKGVNIQMNAVTKSLHSDTQSVKSYKSDSGKALTKREKQQLKRELLMRKFDGVRASELKNKGKKRLKAKTGALAVPGLMGAPGDVKLEARSKPAKGKAVQKAKRQRKLQLQGMEAFRTIAKSKTFQAEPRSHIETHIKSLLGQDK